MQQEVVLITGAVINHHLLEALFNNQHGALVFIIIILQSLPINM